MIAFRNVFLSLLLLATIASAIALVYAIQQSRLAFIELSKLGNERDDLNFEFGRLQLEQATWAETNRIEQVATERRVEHVHEAGTAVGHRHLHEHVVRGAAGPSRGHCLCCLDGAQRASELVRGEDDVHGPILP